MTEEIERHVPEFAGYFGRDALGRLLAVAKVEALAGGAVLTRDGAPVDTLYLVLDGVFTVTVEQDGKSLQIGRVGRGKWIGEVTLLGGFREASSTVVAEGAARVLALRHADFERLKREDLEVAGRLTHLLIEVLIERLRGSAANPVRTADGRLILPGADRVQAATGPIDRGWLKGLFQRLTGIEEQG